MTDHLTPSLTLQVLPPEDDPDDGRAIMAMFTKELRRRLKEKPEDITAAEMTVILRLLADNSISLASIKRGDFGGTAMRVAEAFPFDSEGRMVQ